MYLQVTLDLPLLQVIRNSFLHVQGAGPVSFNQSQKSRCLSEHSIPLTIGQTSPAHAYKKIPPKAKTHNYNADTFAVTLNELNDLRKELNLLIDRTCLKYRIGVINKEQLAIIKFTSQLSSCLSQKAVKLYVLFEARRVF